MPVLERQSANASPKSDAPNGRRRVATSFDIIVPCYGYGRFLRECVLSVLNQPVQNLRVLIIDDASPDNTADVATDLAKSDSRVTFIAHPKNKGHVATYNEGIEWASADYMMILSADDYLLPGALGRAAEIMDAHPEVGLTFGKAIVLDDRGSTADMRSLGSKNAWRILAGLDFIQLSGGRNIVDTPSAVVRTALQQRLGGYRPELPHTGDMEMWLRFAAHSSVGITEAYQAVYRRHSKNMSLAYMGKSWLPDLKEREAALDSFFRSCSDVLPNAAELRGKLVQSLAAEAVSFASWAFNAGENEASTQLSDYAVSLYPGVRSSWRWMKLSCKRRLGLRAWRALQSAVARIR